MGVRAVNRIALIAVALTGMSAVPASSADEVDQAALDRLEAPPLGLAPVPLPGGEPPTAAQIALGRKLFFDRRLSGNNTMSCGMCHIPEQGFTNNELATPIGVEGRSLRRNAPSLLNAAYRRHLFWDGRETMLETQVISPLLAKKEMANPSIGHLIDRIAELPDYGQCFERAFGGGPSIERVGRAIAAWERTLLAAASPFDRWRYGGETDALTATQKRGFELFVGKAGCANCHLVGDEHALLTDRAFHDTGLGYYNARIKPVEAGPVPVEIAPGVEVQLSRRTVRSVGEPPVADMGRYEVTLEPTDLWRYKTPSLRNVALTAPYMHDGSLGTLRDVVTFYDRGGHAHPGLDPLIAPLGLAEAKIDALVAFLESLTGAGIEALVADARSQPVGN